MSSRSRGLVCRRFPLRAPTITWWQRLGCISGSKVFRIRWTTNLFLTRLDWLHIAEQDDDGPGDDDEVEAGLNLDSILSKTVSFYLESLNEGVSSGWSGMNGMFATQPIAAGDSLSIHLYESNQTPDPCPANSQDCTDLGSRRISANPKELFATVCGKPLTSEGGDDARYEVTYSAWNNVDDGGLGLNVPVCPMP